MADVKPGKPTAELPSEPRRRARRRRHRHRNRIAPRSNAFTWGRN